MRDLSPYDVRMSYAGTPVKPNVNFSYTGADWMGPLTPMQPVAPPQVAGRVLDYVPGYNLTTQPRYAEPVTFGTLRALADAYDPLRLVIERRKDQMCRLPWTIRAKHDEPGRKRPSAKDLPKQVQNRIRDITEFFKKPDQENTFRGWMRSLLEDVLVIDAPSMYCQRNRGGDLIGLNVIDGALIKRVIDDWGRTPQPIPFEGSFMWNGAEITEQNHQAYGFKMVPGFAAAHMLPRGTPVPRAVMLPPAYQQILKGLPAVNYTTWDLYYRPLNKRPNRIYGFSPVEQVISTVNIAIRRAYHQLEYYREGNTPEGFYSLPEDWTPDQIQKFQDYWDNLMSGQLGQRRRIRFMAGKGTFTPVREPPLKNDFDEWLIRIVCLAFSYPPNALVALSNRSIADQHEKQAEEEGIEPLKQWAEETFNEIIANDLGSDDLEFAWVEENEIDQAKQAEILTTYASKGALTINQMRERMGEEPDSNKAANMLMVLTPAGYVPIDALLTENKVADAKAMAAAVPKPEPSVATTKESEES